MAIIKLKEGHSFNIYHQHFLIDSDSDLTLLETTYNCQIGDIAELPNGNYYIRHSNDYQGDLWELIETDGSGGITPSGTKTINISESGTNEVDVTEYATAEIVVPDGTEGTPTATKGTVSNHAVTVTPGVTNVGGFISGGTHTGVGVSVSASELVSGAKSITANGNEQDVVNYATVNVSVPNSYTAGDEGKVVSNSALVAQTSDTVTQNGTVDTTLINSLTVNVSGGGGGVASGTFTPAESGLTATIADLAGTSLNHIFIKPQGALDDGLSGTIRSIGVAYFDFSTHTNSFSVGTNTGGTSMGHVANYPDITPAHLYFDRTTGTLTLQSGQGSGYLIAGVTYEWFAW